MLFSFFSALNSIKTVKVAGKEKIDYYGKQYIQIINLVFRKLDSSFPSYYYCLSFKLISLQALGT